MLRQEGISRRTRDNDTLYFPGPDIAKLGVSPALVFKPFPLARFAPGAAYRFTRQVGPAPEAELSLPDLVTLISIPLKRRWMRIPLVGTADAISKC
jgi:hypothetical protein